MINLICVLITLISVALQQNSVYYGSCYYHIRVFRPQTEVLQSFSVDMFGKDTNNFIYVLPAVCFPKNNIETVKLLLCVLEGYVILMKNLKSIVQNMKTV